MRHLRQLNDQQHATTTDSQYTQRHRASYNSKALPHLANMLNQFFAIDVFKQPDTFPQSICTLCYNAVEYFQQLCSVAEQSNEMLTRMAVPQPDCRLAANLDASEAEACADTDAGTHLVGIYK